MKKIQGLIAAAFTPMDQDGEINLDMIESLYKYYIQNDVKGVFLNGSTGEGLSLTIEERLQLCETWSNVIDGDLKLIVHVGSNSLKEAKELACHANKMGAWGIASIGPFYRKPATMELLVEYCRNIAGEAPELPFYYYHIPELTGIDFHMIDFLKATEEEIPNLAGLKYTDTDLSDCRLCIDFEEGRYDILYGNDELFLCGLTLGVKGFVGSTYNLYPKLYHDIKTAFEAHELEKARTLQTKAIEFVRLIDQYGYASAAKAAMKFLGVDCGPTRLPLKTLDVEQIKRLEADLVQYDFFDHALISG